MESVLVSDTYSMQIIDETGSLPVQWIKCLALGDDSMLWGMVNTCPSIVVRHSWPICTFAPSPFCLAKTTIFVNMFTWECKSICELSLAVEEGKHPNILQCCYLIDGLWVIILLCTQSWLHSRKWLDCSTSHLLVGILDGLRISSVMMHIVIQNTAAGLIACLGPKVIG